METVLNLMAAVLSLLTAMAGLFALERLTRVGRLRRRLDFLRAELASRDMSDARTRALRQMQTEALARLVAIEIVPAGHTLKALGITIGGFFVAVWLGRELPRVLAGGPVDLIALTFAAATAIGGGMAGPEQLILVGRERERIQTMVLDGEPFSPAFTLARRLRTPSAVLARGEAVVPLLLRGLGVLISGVAVGVISVAMLDRAALPATNWLTLSAMAAIPALFLTVGLGTMVAGFRKGAPPITQEQYVAVLSEEERRVRLSWGIPEPLADPPPRPASTQNRAWPKLHHLILAWALGRAVARLRAFSAPDQVVEDKRRT